MRPLVCPLWSESWIISHVAQSFPASAFTLSPSGGWDSKSRTLHPALTTCCHCQPYGATCKPKPAWSLDKKKRFAKVCRRCFMYDLIKKIYIYLLFIFRFCSLIRVSAETCPFHDFSLLCRQFPLVSKKLRVNKWSTSALRHTCWVADLCFNVSFVWRLVFQHPQLE